MIAIFLLAVFFAVPENERLDMDRGDALAFCEAALDTRASHRGGDKLIAENGNTITDGGEIQRMVEISRAGKKDFQRLPAHPPRSVFRYVNAGDFACVAVIFDINEKGRTENLEVLASATTMSIDGAPLNKFEKATLTVILKWKYIPIEFEGNLYRRENVTSNMTFTFN